MLSLTNHRHASSLTSSAIHRWFRRISLFIFELVTSEVIFAHQNLISNCLTYVKSTDELISFGFSDRSSEVWSQRNAQLIPESKQKRLHFLADLWSQSEFRTQRKSNPKSEMTRCPVTVYKCTMQLNNYFQVKPGRKILSFLYISFFCSWLCVLSFMANKRRLSIYQTSGSIKRCTEKGYICPIIGELWSEPNTRRILVPLSRQNWLAENATLAESLTVGRRARLDRVLTGRRCDSRRRLKWASERR